MCVRNQYWCIADLRSTVGFFFFTKLCHLLPNVCKNSKCDAYRSFFSQGSVSISKSFGIKNIQIIVTAAYLLRIFPTSHLTNPPSSTQPTRWTSPPPPPSALFYTTQKLRYHPLLQTFPYTTACHCQLTTGSCARPQIRIRSQKNSRIVFVQQSDERENTARKTNWK